MALKAENFALSVSVNLRAYGQEGDRNHDFVDLFGPWILGPAAGDV